MSRRIMSRPRGGRRRAFTLLEILLVVGLLALLAAFAIPNLVGQGEKAKIGMARTAVLPNGPIGQSINLYKFNMGKYPEELKNLIDKPSDEDELKKWGNEPYLQDARGLKDPWGNDYMYEAPGKHNESGYDLWSKGPDGIDGNDDDVVSWVSDRG